MLTRGLPAGTDTKEFIKVCKIEDDKVLTRQDSEETIKTIIAQLKLYFPIRVDWQKLFTIKQKETENVNAYYARTLAEMAKFTGITEVKENPQNRELLVSVIMTGLKECLRQRIQISTPDWTDLDSNALRTLAVSHERNLVKKKENQSEKLMALSIQALQPTKRQYNGQQKGGQLQKPITCYQCGQEGHKRWECPENREREDQNRTFPRQLLGPHRSNGGYRRGEETYRSEGVRRNAAVSNMLRNEAEELQRQ